MKVKLTAPEGKKLRDIRTEKEHSEVIIEESKARFFVVADSDEDPIVEEIDGVTLGERVSNVEEQNFVLDAKIEYVAMMTDVELPEEEDED